MGSGLHKLSKHRIDHPSSPWGTHPWRQGSSPSHISHHFPSGPMPGFSPTSFFGQCLKIPHATLKRHCRGRGVQRWTRWGTESKGSWLPWASMHQLKRGQDHARMKKQVIPTTCHHLPNSPYHQLLQEEPRQHCLHGLFQVTKIQAVPLQNHMCFLLPWSKANFN